MRLLMKSKECNHAIYIISLSSFSYSFSKMKDTFVSNERAYLLCLLANVTKLTRRHYFYKKTKKGENVVQILLLS